MNIKKVFNRDMDYNIDFIKMSNDSDWEFIDTCCNSDEFSRYITNDSRISEYIILRRGQRNIGICSFKIEERMGIKTARPIIYISQRKGLSSFMAMNAVSHYLFCDQDIDRLELRIYSDNEQMISIANCGIFTYEGCLKYCKIRENQFIDMYFYSLLKREFYDLFNNA